MFYGRSRIAEQEPSLPKENWSVCLVESSALSFDRDLAPDRDTAAFRFVVDVPRGNRGSE
jgi:hypothetical protein